MYTPAVAHSHLTNDSGAAPPTTPYQKLYAYDVDDNMIYEAWAPPGSLTSATVWAIKQYTYTGGNLTAERWANGRSLFENSWDGRALITYS